MHNAVDGRGSNFLRISLESRKLEIGLSVGFFGINLEFVAGADPPPKEKTAAQVRHRHARVARGERRAHGDAEARRGALRLESAFF